MPVDASIPLQAQGPAPITLNSIAQLMAMKQQVIQNRQQQATTNALRQIYADPSSLGADGLPNPNAVRRISQISPQLGMQLNTQIAGTQEKRALANQHNADAFKMKGGLVLQATEPALNVYDEAISQGMSPSQAQTKAQAVYTENLTNLKQSGVFSDEEKSKMPTAFDPVRVRAGALSYKDRFAEQEKQKSDDRADQRMAQLTKHQDAMEGLAEQREERMEARMARSSENQDPGSALSPDALKAAAARYNVDGTLPPLGMGKSGAKVRDSILNMAADMSQGKDPTQQRVDQIAGKASASARAGLEKTINNIQLAEKTALGSAAQVENLSKNYDRSDSPLANKGINGIREAITGNPKLTALSTGINTLKNEYVKVMSGAGQSTDSARAEADHLINVNMGHEQLMSSINQMKAEMQQAREQAIDSSRQKSDAQTRGSSGKTLTYDPSTGTFK